jgi:hypothetical protein
MSRLGLAGLVRWLLALLSLVAVFMIVLASGDPWDALLGAIIAASILWLFRGVVLIDEPSRSPPFRVASLPSSRSRRW